MIKLEDVVLLTNEVKKEESEIKISKNPSHVYLQFKNKTRITDTISSKQLTHLYLHNNQIEKIEHLNNAVNLRELYLHNNKIKKIENLEKLTQLKRLHLGHNEISVVEGLEGLELLEELYLEKQRLRDGDSLCFDPRSIFAIKETLKSLDCCRDNVTDVSSLAPLTELRFLDISENSLASIKEVCDVVGKFSKLEHLVAIGNPISKMRKYRECLIGCTDSMKLLDNKSVNEITRIFIRRMERQLLKKKSSPGVNLSHLISEFSKSYSDAVQKTVSRSILEKANNQDAAVGCGDAANVFLPVKITPNQSSKKNKKKKLRPGVRNKLNRVSLFSKKNPKSEENIKNLVFVSKVKVARSSSK